MKRIFTLIVTFSMILTLFSCNKVIMDENNQIEDQTNEKDDNFIIDGTYHFTADKLYELSDENETTNLSLEDGLMGLINQNNSGIYQSKALKVVAFKELVLSFNLREVSDGSVMFFVAVGNESEFSSFYTMGTWLNGKYRSSSNQNDDFAKVNIDTLINREVSNEFIKIKVVINPGETSKLKNITITTKKVDDTFNYNESDLIEKVLQVPEIAQLSIPKIGNLICSPTSITMVLNYYGNNLDVVEVASYVLDTTTNIYGNWSFNVSYAGSFEGLIGYVQYINDIKDVVNYIKEDIPVVFSISTKEKSDLEGSIMAYPAGHLIVLVGFEKINNEWYGVFNDPAEYENNKVLRKYPIKQVLDAWKLYSYVIKKG